MGTLRYDIKREKEGQNRRKVLGILERRLGLQVESLEKELNNYEKLKKKLKKIKSAFEEGNQEHKNLFGLEETELERQVRLGEITPIQALKVAQGKLILEDGETVEPPDKEKKKKNIQIKKKKKIIKEKEPPPLEEIEEEDEL